MLAVAAAEEHRVEAAVVIARVHHVRLELELAHVGRCRRAGARRTAGRCADGGELRDHPVGGVGVGDVYAPDVAAGIGRVDPVHEAGRDVFHGARAAPGRIRPVPEDGQVAGNGIGHAADLQVGRPIGACAPLDGAARRVDDEYAAAHGPAAGRARAARRRAIGGVHGRRRHHAGQARHRSRTEGGDETGLEVFRGGVIARAEDEHR